jgi:hypothetical protein
MRTAWGSYYQVLCRAALQPRRRADPRRRCHTGEQITQLKGATHGGDDGEFNSGVHTGGEDGGTQVHGARRIHDGARGRGVLLGTPAPKIPGRGQYNLPGTR